MSWVVVSNRTSSPPHHHHHNHYTRSHGKHTRQTELADAPQDGWRNDAGGSCITKQLAIIPFIRLYSRWQCYVIGQNPLTAPEGHCQLETDFEFPCVSNFFLFVIRWLVIHSESSIYCKDNMRVKVPKHVKGGVGNAERRGGFKRKVKWLAKHVHCMSSSQAATLTQHDRSDMEVVNSQSANHIRKWPFKKWNKRANEAKCTFFLSNDRIIRNAFN